MMKSVFHVILSFWVATTAIHCLRISTVHNDTKVFGTGNCAFSLRCFIARGYICLPKACYSLIQLPGPAPIPDNAPFDPNAIYEPNNETKASLGELGEYMAPDIFNTSAPAGRKRRFAVNPDGCHRGYSIKVLYYIKKNGRRWRILHLYNRSPVEYQYIETADCEERGCCLPGHCKKIAKPLRLLVDRVFNVVNEKVYVAIRFIDENLIVDCDCTTN